MTTMLFLPFALLAVVVLGGLALAAVVAFIASSAVRAVIARGAPVVLLVVVGLVALGAFFTDQRTTLVREEIHARERMTDPQATEQAGPVRPARAHHRRETVESAPPRDRSSAAGRLAPRPSGERSGTTIESAPPVREGADVIDGRGRGADPSVIQGYAIDWLILAFGGVFGVVVLLGLLSSTPVRSALARGWPVLIAVGAVGVIVVGVGLLWLAAPQSPGPPKSAVAVRPLAMGDAIASAAVPAPADGGGIDNPLPEVPWLADRYPSAEQARAALGAAMQRDLTEAALDANRVSGQFQRTGDTLILRADLSAELLRQLGLGVEQARARFTYRTEVVPADWLSDYTAFMRRNPANWAVVHSGLAATATEAKAECLRQAAEQLAPAFAQAIRSEAAEHRQIGQDLIRSDQQLRAYLAEHLQGGQAPLLSQYDQSFDRPYGKVYRCAMLVRAEPFEMEHLASVFVAERIGERQAASAVARREAASWGGLGLLAVILLGVYLLLNAATRGYYAWTFRLLAAGVLIAGVLVLLTIS